MLKKVLMFCLLAVAAMLLSIVGGAMVLIAFAGGAATTIGYLKIAAIIWIAGTVVAVLCIIAVTYYLTRYTRLGNKPIATMEKGSHSNNSMKGS